MKRLDLIIIVFIFLTSSFLFTAVIVFGDPKTITVPDDYTTISAALENAAEGATIYVKRGRHKILNNETLIVNMTVSIIGEDPATTFLNGPGFAYASFPTKNEGSINTGSTLLRVEISPSNFLLPPKIGLKVNADNFKISGVTIDNCDIGVSVSGDGTEISNTKMISASVKGSYMIICENTMTGTLTASGSYNSITRNFGRIDVSGSFNIIAGNSAQVDITMKGQNNTFTGNSFSTIFLENANSNTISNNSLNCLWIGFHGHTCSNNTISKNRLTGPGNWGILMGAGSYNVFHDNLISNYTGNCDGYGIAIGGNHFVAENNTFYRNMLINNNRHVNANWEILGAGNYWDNGKEGNYWDDYTGSDINGDGIGDVPYTVNGFKWDDEVREHVSFVFGQDNYPLVTPFKIAEVSTEMPVGASPSSVPSTEHQPETTYPFRTMIIPTSGTARAVFCVGLFVYFKKWKN